MDGDLPKADYFTDDFQPKLSTADGEVHTVVAGRMIGISDGDLRTLARNGVHVHLYTENYHNGRDGRVRHCLEVAPAHFHVHSHISADEWTREFSRYDAGWLHCLRSHNGGDLMNACWDDLNIPARISTYAAAGLPVILQDNTGHRVATQETVRRLDIGIFFRDCTELARMLKSSTRMAELDRNMRNVRHLFCFDHYVPELTALFRKAIERNKDLQPWT